MRPNQKKPIEKKAAPKKPSKATTRSTGGPGYQFEDYVSAWLLVKILLGRPLPGIGTVGDKMQFQVEPLGWRIDDLLVTGDNGGGSAHLAISCKSNHQVTGKGLPADFVMRAWEQWRTTGPITLDMEADTLALVTRGQPNKFPALWSDIVQWCGGGDDAVAVARIRKSASHATIFDSVRKPEGGQQATELETVALIRRLPPWPLGPKDRIDHDFHKAAIMPAGLAPLMRADPERAAEALLALMIEGRPEERYSDYSHRDDLGLSHEHSSYPTSFWKSPFFQFLQINPAAALSALSQLVNFATERWASQYIRRGIEVPTVTLLDGEEAWSFTGNGEIFSWAWDEDLGNGQLYCALNALERWLTIEIEVGHDVEQHIDRLLRECRSVAILGVLVNVAKFRPAFLEGTLLPLLTAEELYWFDVGVGRNRLFNALMWSRAGEVMYNMARDWTFAEYRKQEFEALAVAAIRGSTYVADTVTMAMDAWLEYDRPKDAIESDILRATDDASVR